MNRIYLTRGSYSFGEPIITNLVSGRDWHLPPHMTIIVNNEPVFNITLSEEHGEFEIATSRTYLEVDRKTLNWIEHKLINTNRISL